METGAQQPDLAQDVVGRESELASIRGFFAGEGEARALLLSGEPGIGKTTLWETAVRLAADDGVRVLAARPSGAETTLSFSGLADLLEEVDLARLERLPAPQRNALEIVLFRRQSTGAPPEPFAIASGLLNALRSLAAGEPLLVAIDDLPWLDDASTDALAFSARRLREEPVRFLLARRSRGRSELEHALGQRALSRIQVGALSLGATRQLLLTRLGLSLSRAALLQVLEASQGNPLFALEVGRTLAESTGRPATYELTLPDTLDSSFAPRLKGLPGAVRKALLAVALSDALGVAALSELVGHEAVEEAVGSGLLVVDRGRLRPSHPLGAAARKHSTARTRRVLHLDLGRVVPDEELRARHLALATPRPDAELARIVVAAAERASSRGARREAAGLAEQALRLTPSGADDLPDRLLVLATYFLDTGDEKRLEDLLSRCLDSIPSGLPRARAVLLWSEVAPSIDEYERRLDMALAESPGSAEIRASALGRKARVTTVGRVARIREVEAWSLEALAAAESTGPNQVRVALGGLAWARVFRGRPVDDLCRRLQETPGAASFVADYYGPDSAAAERLMWRGSAEAAHAALGRLLAVAEEQGEESYWDILRAMECDLHLVTGGMRQKRSSTSGPRLRTATTGSRPRTSTSGQHSLPAVGFPRKPLAGPTRRSSAHGSATTAGTS